jgi:hypothetical protein
VTFPTEDAPLVGGQTVRVTVYLQESDGRPVPEARVHAELYAPSGELFARLPCVGHGKGRYLSDPVRLPLRGSSGTWRVISEASWGDGAGAGTQQAFHGLPSYSERLEELYGFWIETSDLFAYNVAHADDPSGKYWPYQDGDGGCVILANSFFRGHPYQHFVVLDMHWRRADLPTDEVGAVGFVQSLAGPHLMDLEMAPGDVAAESVRLQGQAGWRVFGRWESTLKNGNPRPGGFIEWDVFRCPVSDSLWTVVIATNEAEYLEELREIRETFRCPSPGFKGTITGRR